VLAGEEAEAARIEHGARGADPRTPDAEERWSHFPPYHQVIGAVEGYRRVALRDPHRGDEYPGRVQGQAGGAVNPRAVDGTLPIAVVDPDDEMIGGVCGGRDLRLAVGGGGQRRPRCV